MKTKKERPSVLNVRLSKQQRAQLDAIVKRLNISQTAWVHLCIETDPFAEVTQIRIVKRKP